jgi:hypothetical protein
VGRVTLRRWAAGPALAAVLVALSAVPVNAESLLWSLTATPLTATTGVATTFTLTATNEDPLAAALSSSEIGCVVVTLPASFSVAGAGVVGSSAGGSWTAAVDGTKVTVRAGSGGDRLALLEWVRFTINATAKSAGSLIWNAKAYRQQDCSGSGAVLGVPPIVAVIGPTVTPTPSPSAAPTRTPTPTPTSAPTPMPTPKPTQILPLPTLSPLPLPLPTLLPGPTPEPSVPAVPAPSAPPPPRPGPLPGETAAPGRPVGSSAASPSPSPSSSPAPSVGPSEAGGSLTPPAAGGGSGTTGRPAGAPPQIRFEDGRLELGTGNLGVLDGLDVWAVPAATIAGPGLLVLLWILLQSVGAAVWLPAARRLRSDPASARVRSLGSRA